MTSIYRYSPSKRSKPGGAGSGGTGGGGGGGAGTWTLIGEERTGNLSWVCPRHKPCGGHILAKTRKGSTSLYGICDTRRADNADTCQTFFNLNRKHWGSGEYPRVCEWCEGDTGGSPSIGVPNDGVDCTAERES